MNRAITKLITSSQVKNQTFHCYKPLLFASSINYSKSSLCWFDIVDRTSASQRFNHQKQKKDDPKSQSSNEGEWDVFRKVVSFMKEKKKLAEIKQNGGLNSYNEYFEKRNQLIDTIEKECVSNEELKNILLREQVFVRDLLGMRRRDVLVDKEATVVDGKKEESLLEILCPFCNEERIEEGLVSRSFPEGHFYCLYNLKPVFDGHVLVIPRSHYSRISEMGNDVVLEYHTFLKQITHALKQCYGTDSINMLMQEGMHSGQSICHLHVHLFPRQKGDVQMLRQQKKETSKVEEKEVEWMDYFSKHEHDEGNMLTVEQRQECAKRIRNHIQGEYIFESQKK